MRRFRKWIAICACASSILSTIHMPVSTVFATSLENDTAVAGMAVSVNNYYASSNSPEAEILEYLMPMVSATQPTETETAASVNVRLQMEKAVAKGTAAAEDLIEDGAVSSEHGIVSTLNYLNMRKTPSTKAPVVAYLYNNTKVDIFDTVTNEEGTWYLVRANGAEGYIFSSYVLTGEDALSAEANIQYKHATVIVDTLDVLDTAAEGAKVVDQIYLDQTYPVIAYQGNYVKIKISDTLWGFVSRDGVKITTEFAEAFVIDDWYVKDVLDQLLHEIDEAESIYQDRMNARDYSGAHAAITYAIELWNSYISKCNDFSYVELIAAAETERTKAIEQQKIAADILLELQKDAENNVIIPGTAPVVPETTAPVVPETTAPVVPGTTAPVVPETTVPETTLTQSISYINACYRGGIKYAGDVIYAAELFLEVYYVDGSKVILEDPASWYCPEVGMILGAGDKVVTMYYGDYHSSFVLPIQPAQSVPETTVPVVPETTPAPTVPETTVPVVPETTPAPTVPVVPETTPTPTVPETTVPVVPETTPAPTVPVVPETTPAPTVPETTVPVVPETTVPVVPETTPAPTVPETTVPVVPETTPTPTVPETTPAPTVPVVPETTLAPTVPETTPAPQIAVTQQRQSVVNFAASWVGKCNYVYGGNNLAVGGQVDCSAFTRAVYRTVGIEIPRTSAQQLHCGTRISYDQLRPGDLVCYVGHVAIYIGDGAIIHAKNAQSGIVYDSIFYSATQPPIGYVTLLP